MKIAIINQQASTGGWRALKKLVLALSKKAEVTLFVQDIPYYKDYIEIFRKHKICLNQIDDWDNLYTKLNDRYDVALFFWPFGVAMPDKIKIPCAFVVQDLTSLYHFGSYWNHNYDAFFKRFQTFALSAAPVVPTNYGKEDYLKYFSGEAAVIPWPSFADKITASRKRQKEILKKFGLADTDYVLYPTNICPHKNVSIYIAAGNEVRKRGHDIKFILAGHGTEEINGHFFNTGVTNAALRPDKKGFDIKGLGMVTDEEIDTLIANAKIVAATSLAEGGCGPCGDAWFHGVPTVMSALPVLKEFAALYGVDTITASPHNAFEFADGIEKILKDYTEAKKNAAKNQKAVRTNYTWDDAADKYIKFFEKIIMEYKNRKVIAVPFDIDAPADISREGVGVYARFLMDAVLRNNACAHVEFWQHSFNTGYVKNAFSSLAENYPGRVHFFDETVLGPRHNFFVEKYKLKYYLKKALLHARHPFNRLKYLKKRQRLRDKYITGRAEVFNPGALDEAIAGYSNAHYCFIPLVTLKRGRLFNCPKILQIHDLYYVPLRNFYYEIFPDIDRINADLINNVRQYAVSNTTLVTSADYTADEHVMRYVPEAGKDNVKVIPFPPMIKDFKRKNILSEAAFRNKYGIKGPYMALATQNRPNKNLIVLLKAMNVLKNKKINITLATTGLIAAMPSNAKFVADNELEKSIVQTGSLGEEDWYALYKYSSMVVLPTIIEGYGMSGQCMEALKIGGIPVIHAKSWGMEESLKKFGMSFATADLNWFDLDDYNTLADKIAQVLADPRPHLEKQKHILDNYLKITWDFTAGEYMKVFEKMAEAVRK
ncbi:MAG: glycosyltransferase [Elusimicrobia bacterium]|nr:glycosyltransferase [Elusimicrobiota bacterium]